MKSIPIPAGKPDEVLIGRGLLSEAGRETRKACPKAEKAFLVTDDLVAPLYAGRVRQSLEEAMALVERLRSEGLSLKDAAKQAAAATGQSRNDLYHAALVRDGEKKQRPGAFPDGEKVLY